MTTREEKSFLRVISDGTPGGTTILDDRNRVVQNVSAFVIRGDSRSLVTVELTLIDVEVDIAGVSASASSPSSSSPARPHASFHAYLPNAAQPMTIETFKELDPWTLRITISEGLHEDVYRISERVIRRAQMKPSGVETEYVMFTNDDDSSITRFMIAGSQLFLAEYRNEPCRVEIR